MLFQNGNWQQFLISKKDQFNTIPADCNITEDEIYLMFRNRILNIILNRFVWENLPDEIPSWFVENTLLYQGIAAVWQDDILDKHFISPVVLEGHMDIYGLLTTRHIQCPNGINAIRSKKDSVIIFDTYNNFPTLQSIYTYAKLLTRITLIYLKNIDLQKRSIGILSNQDTLLSTKNVVKELSEGVEYLVLKDTFDLSNIKPIDIKIPYIASDLRIQIKELWIECLNSFGIEGYTTNKKEREVSGETEGNLGFVEIARNAYLNPRKNALEEMKKMFPIFEETEVKFNSKLNTELNIPFLKESGDFDDVEIYNNISRNSTSEE